MINISVPVSAYCILFAQVPPGIFFLFIFLRHISNEREKREPLWLSAGLALLNVNIALQIWLIHLILRNGRRERQLILNVSSPLTGSEPSLPPRKTGEQRKKIWRRNWWDRVTIMEFNHYYNFYFIVLDVLLFNGTFLLQIHHLAVSRSTHAAVQCLFSEFSR